MTRSEKAVKLFEEGYNCSQAVLLAFADLIPGEPEDLARMASSFGAGMGKLREVCGAASGMFMAAGFLYGYSDPAAREEKTAQYALVQQLAAEFERDNGSIICRQLLGLEKKKEDPVPAERTPEYYKKRPCKELCGLAAGYLEKYIEEHPVGKA